MTQGQVPGPSQGDIDGIDVDCGYPADGRPVFEDELLELADQRYAEWKDRSAL